MSFHAWKLCLVFQMKYNGKVERALEKRTLENEGNEEIKEIY